MKTKGNQHKLVDHLFWISFLVFTNPGGILMAMGAGDTDGGINITDVLMVVLLGCYLSLVAKNDIFNDESFSTLIKFISILLIYYLLVFGFFVPILKSNSNYLPMVAFIKMRHGIVNVMLVFIVYEFFLRSFKLFFKYFLYLSIAVMIMFLITTMSGIEILPIKTMDRSFVDTQRLLMVNYGLLPLLIPMGAIVFMFKFKIKYKKLILIAFVLMFIVWLLSLIRRNIFGTFIYILLALMLNNYLQHKALVSIQKIFKIIFYAIFLIGIIQLTFPKYLEAGIVAGEETINVIKYGETKGGRKDTRLGFGKDFMQNLIKENYVFGTGFDNRWRTSEGDKAGYEASDYPLLSAIAMSGIIGLLFFLPIYIVLIKTLHYDIKYLRKNKLNTNSLESFFIILFILYFIYDLMQYMNWFLPLSLFSHAGHKSWFIFIAMYFASRRLFYYKYEPQNQSLEISKS
ncbi:hypothetical protein QWY87_11750 [Lutimonas halocynthiae]|uniref:hypothetical protein n=1 Tax=Lutimonas halocynthiae TaxID=1446477 RepID=UPI0025B33EE0|nr:hypothetical protein [Lutimonas halocynthiae]MDN3643378.1 hypothetical protein [Lutimonas halocynthiae]